MKIVFEYFIMNEIFLLTKYPRLSDINSCFLYRPIKE